MYSLNSPQKSAPIIHTVTTETRGDATTQSRLNAPDSVLTVNESSVEGFISNFFNILRIELIPLSSPLSMSRPFRDIRDGKDDRIPSDFWRVEQTEQTLDFLPSSCSDSSSEWGTTRFFWVVSTHQPSLLPLPYEYQMDPRMHIILPRTPIGRILLLKRYTERMIITTCFTFPATFIMSGPPSFTALKLATFKKNAKTP